MDDTQLNSLRREPPPAFAARLQASLRAHDASQSKVAWPRVRSIVAPALIAAAIVGLVSVPAVRASAQSFLALFRVVNFVAVPVDENRLARLAAENLDPPHLIGEQLQVLEDPGPPTAVASPEQAGAAAGFAVRTPGYMPTAVYPAGITVKGQQHLQVTPDAERLQQAMDALAINDLEIPQGLDGGIVDVRISPVVVLRYDRGGALAAQLLQARSPTVSLPNGLDLRALGEIGLRILGLSPVEAREFAAAISWQSTLILPLPANASSFKQVDINGHRGVVIERARQVASGGRAAFTSLVMWAADGMVYTIDAPGLSSGDSVRMAESLK
ncbi:MAG TPA: hypothetical protein VMS40_03865 [Vicinamibacterales bacterium]|nr:hypothetical protein [Vicinamibacterales bacterium]